MNPFSEYGIYVNGILVPNAVGWWVNEASKHVLFISANDQVVATWPDAPATHIYRINNDDDYREMRQHQEIRKIRDRQEPGRVDSPGGPAFRRFDPAVSGTRELGQWGSGTEVPEDVELWAVPVEDPEATIQCRHCGLSIEAHTGPACCTKWPGDFGYHHTEGWSSGTFTHRAYQVNCEPDMQTCVAAP